MTFGDLAEHIMHKVISMATNLYAASVHLLTDNYPAKSIKNAERGRRAADGVQRVKIYGSDQQVPRQWKKFLSCGSNKEALVEFLFVQWSKCEPEKLKGVKLYFTHGQLCHSFCGKNGNLYVEAIPELASNHEEADTRLLLHSV